MFGSLSRLFRRPAGPSPSASQRAAEPARDWRKRGNEALAAGAMQQAADCYREGTHPPPGEPVAWLNLGYVLLEMGQHAEARASLQRAEALLPPQDPGLGDVWALLGRERQERRDWTAAADYYLRVLERAPSHAQVWRELGQVRELQGLLDEAEAAYERAVALAPDFELALRDLARLLVSRGRYEQALPFARRAAGQPHPHPEAYLLLSNALGDTSQLADGLRIAQRALAAGYDESVAVVRATILSSLGRAEEAVAAHDEVLARAPDNINALVDSARALQRLLRYDEALERLARAERIESGRIDVASAKAAILLGRNECEQALHVLQHEVSPEYRDHKELEFIASTAYLVMGDFERGWAAYESRWHIKHNRVANQKPRFPAPEWRGEPLQGKSILLYREQGLGDSLQMLRYAPLVAAQAGKVWLQIQPALLDVVGALPANCELVRDARLPEVDFTCPLLSLPRLLGTRLQSIPGGVPYLCAPDASVQRWSERLGARDARLRVGIAWSGNAQHSNDSNRSIPLEAVRQTARADVEFISLQQELRPGDESEVAEWPQLRHFGAEIGSFADTAALASLVDVVVSVDTSVAHLAGGLGRPLSLLLPYAPDWRWLLGRHDSPWYPSAKLYRQPAPGDWGPPLARAMAELEQRAAAAATPPAST